MNTGASPLDLRGLRVLLTRPHPHNDSLRQQLENAGAEVRLLPMLGIRAVAETPALRQTLMNLDRFAAVIVVSPNAARFAIERIEQYWPQWPIGIDWFSVGSGTAAILRNAGIAAQHPQQGHDSEALLALPRLQQVAGERILILRGRGGRELLADELRARGADIEYAELYERCPPQCNAAELKTNLQDFQPHIVLLFSGETLAHFLDLSQTHGINLDQQLLWLPSERALAMAQQRGLQRLQLMPLLDDAAIVEAIGQWHHPL